MIYLTCRDRKCSLYHKNLRHSVAPRQDRPRNKKHNLVSILGSLCRASEGVKMIDGRAWEWRWARWSEWLVGWWRQSWGGVVGEGNKYIECGDASELQGGLVVFELLWSRYILKVLELWSSYILKVEAGIMNFMDEGKRFIAENLHCIFYNERCQYILTPLKRKNGIYNKVWHTDRYTHTDTRVQ